MNRFSGVALVCLVLLGRPCGSSAQRVEEHERWAGATWVDDLNFLGANALLGGITAGVASYLRSGSFVDGFAGGALGGGVAYAGKRVAAARFDGAGLVGRQLGAVGGSLTRNAALGGGLVDTLVLPLGPAWAVVTPHAVSGTKLRVDLEATGWLIAGLLEDRLRFDWGRSLSAGAPVFRTDGGIRSAGETVDGISVGGLIVLGRWTGSHAEDVFAHERVHVVQLDYLKTTLGLPIEQWARGKARIDRLPFADHFVVGVAQAPIHYLLTGPWSRSKNLIEVEATFLEVR